MAVNGIADTLAKMRHCLQFFFQNCGTAFIDAYYFAVVSRGPSLCVSMHSSRAIHVVVVFWLRSCQIPNVTIKTCDHPKPTPNL